MPMKTNCWRNHLTKAWLALFCFAGQFSVLAEEKSADSQSALMRYATQDYMLGTWGGLRTDLSKHGVDFEFFYDASFPMNLDGGLKRGDIYQGALLMTLDLDSQKLIGYEGGTLHVGALWLNGEKPFSDKYVGDLNKVNLIDFNNAARLWDLWYEQKFFDGKVSLKAGDMVIDHDFIVPEFYNGLASINLLNQTFFYPTMAFNVYDQPFFPKGNHGLPSTPYGVLGARLRFDPCQYMYFQVGAYDGKPEQEGTGFDFKLSDEEGALIYYEAGLKINQTKDAKGPPGNIKVGGYYHTDDFYDMRDGTYAAFDGVSELMTGSKLSDILAYYSLPVDSAFLNPRKHSGNYGFYFLADQTIWREVGKDDPAHQGLVGFFRAAYAPPDRNLAQLGIDGGLVYKGLIPGRDYDTLSVAGSYLEMSDDLRKAQKELNTIMTDYLGEPAPFTKLADYEVVLEMSYKAQMTAWWTVQPSLQRVLHPGGRVLQATPDAWVFILQTTFRF